MDQILQDLTIMDENGEKAVEVIVGKKTNESVIDAETGEVKSSVETDE